MADNLPLIPSKSTECKDVRPVLRRVFRELDFLPPLATEASTQRNTQPVGDDGDHVLPTPNCWVKQYKAEYKEISDHEVDIKDQFAKRIAKESLPNIFKLHRPEAVKEQPKWRLEKGLIDRKDLRPTIEQNAGKDGCLWIKNILNASSGDVRAVQMSTPCVPSPALLSPVDGASVQSYSIEKVISHPPPLPLSNPPTPIQPQHIVCLPSHLEFVNFTVGQLHTKCLRLINVSKFECRLSITPTKCRELDIEISGFRGLVVTPGASVEIKVHFRPTDVRAVNDVVAIRVSCGQAFVIPISCYMQPPLLRISVPSINSATQISICESRSSYGSHHDADVVDLGSRLLGDVHSASILLHCDDRRATFFMLTEDAWTDWNIDCVTSHGCVMAGDFVWYPSLWRGGGVTQAQASCHAVTVGVHVATVRVLSRTAVTRPLQLLADVLHFKRDHLIIQAHQKDYDICSEDDPDCEYYVNLGTAFPHRALSATVQLVNKSPILYNYHWQIRPWGVCHCWDEQKESTGSIGSDITDQLCIGAVEARRISQENPDAFKKRDENSHLVRIEPDCGHILPHSSSAIRVSVPDTGGHIGVQRAVIMLILDNIPKESFPEGYDPMIVRTHHVETIPIPGIESSSHEVCEVMAAQVEVWWEVVPLQFVLDPPVLSLCHSRRVNSTEVRISSWQLYGLDECHVSWVTPRGVVPPSAQFLSTAHCATTTINLPLPSLPNEYPETDLLTMVADNEEWKTKCIVTRQCELRHPTIRPCRAFLGVVAPGTNMKTVFLISNETYQNLYYWCEAHRWIGENEPRPACVGRNPCESCKEVTCTCALIQPRKGALKHGEIAKIYYNVNAPMKDGCVATLVQARRCWADLAQVQAAPGVQARAALVAYRVVAPRLVARLLPCLGLNPQCSAGCGLDEGALNSKLGSAVLRPSRALVVGRRTCYRLRLTNISPLPTAVHFDTPIDGTDLLKIKFTPNDFNVKPYGQVDVRVMLEALQVCDRRIFVYQALVLRGHQPLYLVVDTAISGIRISCQVPLGGDDVTDDFIIITRTQKQDSQNKSKQRPSTTEIFAEEDSKRAFIKENICRCPFKMVYIPPVKIPQPPPAEEEYCSPIDIVEEPPPLTRKCPCDDCAKPYIREAPESISLQFFNIPLKKVCERRVILHNESVVTAHWTATVRRWPRKHVRSIAKDEWCIEESSPGVSLSCRMSRGVLGANATVVVYVRVFALSWGFYRDQILIQIDNVEPIVLDVWVEAVGAPLQLKMHANTNPDDIPAMWISTSDPERTLHVKNISRSELAMQAYVTKQYEWKQDVLPFRLYLRFYDLPPIPCPCCTTYDYEVGDTSEASYDMEMDTGLELYLAPDCGPQDNTYYKVSPEECSIAAGECMKLEIKMSAPPHPQLVPDTILLLRLTPLQRSGEWWYRPEPPPQVVRLRQAARDPRLELSCDDVTVNVCAVDLPYESYLRIRRHFRIQNVGSGILDMSACTTSPWCLIQDYSSEKGDGAGDMQSVDRKQEVNLSLPPMSSIQMSVEVCICTKDTWPSRETDPSAGPHYPPRRRNTTPLQLYDDYLVLKTLPLTLDIEFPVIQANPAIIDFGFVTDGDSRKSYITVSHTSRTKTLRLMTRWVGCEEFKICPTFLEVPPGGCSRVYVQYTAVWRRGLSEGCCHVGVHTDEGEGAGTWCRQTVSVRASPTRDHGWRDVPHDYTDETILLPPSAQAYVISSLNKDISH